MPPSSVPDAIIIVVIFPPSSCAIATIQCNIATAAAAAAAATVTVTRISIPVIRNNST